MTSSDHWDDVYDSKASDEVSWFQRDPAVSLRLVATVPGSVLDVGAGASALVDGLLAAGRTDVTLVDLSANALEATKRRLADRAGQVTFEVGDICGWVPGRTFDCWHDRAVFHFLTETEQQRSYVETAARLIAPGGALIIGTFAAGGPTSCSGLPTARYEPGDLAGVFASDFELEHSEHETHQTPWKAPQHFTWAVFRRTKGKS